MRANLRTPLQALIKEIAMTDVRAIRARNRLNQDQFRQAEMERHRRDIVLNIAERLEVYAAVTHGRPSRTQTEQHAERIVHAVLGLFHGAVIATQERD